VPCEVAVFSRTDSLENCRQFLPWGLTQGNTDDLDELLPTDEVPEVTDIADQFITGIHV
jgi:hypothetical protein